MPLKDIGIVAGPNTRPVLLHAHDIPASALNKMNKLSIATPSGIVKIQPVSG